MQRFEKATVDGRSRLVERVAQNVAIRIGDECDRGCGRRGDHFRAGEWLCREHADAVNVDQQWERTKQARNDMRRRTTR